MATILVSVSVPAEESEPGKPAYPSWRMVVDRAGVLDDGQEESARNDAWRLTQIGVPTQVVTELAGLNQDQANRRAEELRISNRIESTPGANDGVLIYLAVNARDRDTMTLAISVGENAVPNMGLTAETMAETYGTVMIPQLEAGKPARAIVYGMRRFIYLQQFEPAALPALASRWKGVASLLQFVAPAAMVISIASAGLSIRSRGARRWVLAIVPLMLAAAIAVPAVPARSTLAIACALVAGCSSLVAILIAERPAVRKPGRTLATTPRPLGVRSIGSSR